jgi:hypothetical protein
MKQRLIIAVAASLLTSAAALAQTTTTTPTTPSTPATPPTVGAQPSTPSTSTDGALTMTTEQAQRLVDKTVYSSDNKNLGEVAAVQRDSSGKVTEIHADIGGFLGLGETRVRIMPSQMKIADDRVTLNISSEEAKNLPKIGK